MPNFSIQIARPVSREAAIKAGCGVLPAGFPFLIDCRTGQIEHEPTVFLRKRCLGGGSYEHLVVSVRTALCRAYDLKDFVEYLRATKTAYTAVSADVLYGYAATMAGKISLHTGEQYSHLTITRRVWTAIEFCCWLGRQEAISFSQMDGIERLRRGRASLARNHKTRFSGGTSPTLLPTQFKQHEPRILDDGEARRLLRALAGKEEASNKNADSNVVAHAIGRRNLLMAKVALSAGLRREEVCLLERGKIEGVVIETQNRALHPIVVSYTKNNSPRKVLMPSSLIKELQEFCRTERAAICGAHCKGRCGMTGALFPSTGRMSSERCAPMCPQNLGLIVRNAAMKAGIVRTVYPAKSSQRARKEVVADVSVHDLRHSYAVWTYLILRSQGDTNPWLYVQAQLGHRSSETTINTYLRMARIFENAIAQTIADYALQLSAAFDERKDD
jgi:integrase/recombinase XerC